MNNQIAQLTAFLLFAISFVTIVIFLIVLSCDGYSIGIPVAMAETGQVGDFIGGVVGTIISAAAFVFLYLTFREQRKTSNIQHIESHFFEMLRMHQINVTSMRYDASRLIIDKGSLYIAPVIYEGRSVFDVIFMQLVTCRNELRRLLCKHRRLYVPEYELILQKNERLKERNIDIYELGYIDIAYCIVFFGVNSEGIMILKNLLSMRYKKKLVETVLRFISLKPASNKNFFKRWNYISGRSRRRQILELVDDIYEWRQNKHVVGYQPRFPQYSVGYNNDFVKYYGGYQHLLSHYYRHMFHMIKYINELSSISYENKYRYVKSFQAQLSNTEQTLLFFNSISSLGRQWELDPDVNHDLPSFKVKDFELISKYDLIKNIPGEMLYGVNYKRYYPFVSYEGDNSRYKKQGYR